MMVLIREFLHLVSLPASYVFFFFVSLFVTLALVPVCRRLCMFLGMVDQPGARRINKRPIPRGGGIAIFLGMLVSVAIYWFVLGKLPCVEGAHGNIAFLRMTVLAALIVVLGFVDDKFSLPPVIKLLGQLLLAGLVFFWTGIGIHHLFGYTLPVWLDAVLTIFWIVGAVNAFNLIDGIDGLASGLAFISAVGMMGVLFVVNHASEAIFYCGFAGACLGFLRYNFNPASVFLGDAGSMYLGFVLSTLPLAITSSISRSANIALIVPILAMGVPVFDTALAIVRRSIRALLKCKRDGGDEGETHIMHADTDHLHHRILRKFGSQRKAALILYLMAFVLMLVAVAIVTFKNSTAGIYILTFSGILYVIFKELIRVEFWDLGRLANTLVHSPAAPTGLDAVRMRHRFKTLFLILFDIMVLCVGWILSLLLTSGEVSRLEGYPTLLFFVLFPFLVLVFTRTYKIVWGRAYLLNFVRIVFSIFSGTLVAVAFMLLHIVTIPATLDSLRLVGACAIFAANTSLVISVAHFGRAILREIFYIADNQRVQNTDDVERILVYGSGLRYRTFRRELMRAMPSSHRTIVGIIDDNPVFQKMFIGSVPVLGTIHDLGRVAQESLASRIIICCKLTPDRLKEVSGIIHETTKLKVSVWLCDEVELPEIAEVRHEAK